MDLKNLLKSNEIQRELLPIYMERLHILYPDYEIFESVCYPDFIIFRKKVGESKFGEKPNIFTVDIKKDILVYYTQLYFLM